MSDSRNNPFEAFGSAEIAAELTSGGIARGEVLVRSIGASFLFVRTPEPDLVAGAELILRARHPDGRSWTMYGSVVHVARAPRNDISGRARGYTMRLGRTQAKAEVPATAALPERDPASSGEYRSLPPSPHGPASFVGEITPPLPHPAIPAEGSWAPVPPPGAWAAGPPAYGPPGYQPPIPPGFASGPPPGMPAYPPHVAPAYAYPPGFPPPPAAYGPPPGSPNTTGRFAAPAFANSTGRFAAPLPQGPEASMAMRPSTAPYAPPPGYGPPPSSGNLPVLPPQSFPPAPEPPPMRPDVTGRFAALVAPPGPESSGSWPVYGAWSPPPPRPASGYHAPNQAPPVPPIGFGYPPKK